MKKTIAGGALLITCLALAGISNIGESECKRLVEENFKFHNVWCDERFKAGIAKAKRAKISYVEDQRSEIVESVSDFNRKRKEVWSHFDNDVIPWSKASKDLSDIDNAFGFGLLRKFFSFATSVRGYIIDLALDKTSVQLHATTVFAEFENNALYDLKKCKEKAISDRSIGIKDCYR